MNYGRYLAIFSGIAIMVGAVGGVFMAFTWDTIAGCIATIVLGIIAYTVSGPVREAFEERQASAANAFLVEASARCRKENEKMYAELTELRAKHKALRLAGLTLYGEGTWSCLQLPDAVQRQRWEDLRDALGLESPGVNP